MINPRYVALLLCYKSIKEVFRRSIILEEGVLLQLYILLLSLTIEEFLFMSIFFARLNTVLCSLKSGDA